ncbi:MAG: autotransporter domain-containing protein [Akkermansia sp.]|nr:autotransporter domain-containing protein [Akkermansia sp.]
MLKNRFILSVLAACSCSALVQAASPFTYSYEDHPGSGLKDVTVTLEASWNGVLSPTGYSPDPGNRVPAAYEEVHDSEVNVVEGASSSYIVSAEAHNEGIVRGKRTINMAGGHVWGLIGGHVYYKDILESFTPYNSKEDVVINLRGGSATRVNGGGLFSVEKIIKEDGTKVVCSSGEYVALKGGTAALAVGGDVYINVTGSGEVKEEMFGGGSYGSVDGKVTIVFDDDAKFGTNNTNVYDCCIFGGAKRGSYVGSSEIIIKGNADINGRIYGGSAESSSGASTVKGDTRVSIQGGIVRESVYGAGQKDNIGGETFVSIEGGHVTGNVYGGGDGSTIEKDVNVTLSGGVVDKAVYGAGVNDTVKGDVKVTLLGGDWSETDIYAAGEGATVEGETYLIVGTGDGSYNGAVKALVGFDHLVVHENSSFNMGGINVFSVNSQTITLSEANLRRAAVSGAYAAVGENGLTLNIQSSGRLRSGKYMVASVDSLSRGRATDIDVPEGWNAGNVTVTGIAGFDDLTWEGTTLYLTYESLYAQAAVAANWGVFKSSQAFTGTLSGKHGNAISLDKTDGKRALTAVRTAENVAWGTVYGQGGRISGVGADYSLYGAAIGAEHRIGSRGRSIGLAFGYDCGKVSPFTTSSVDQDTWHAAVYGRVATFKAGKGTLAVDWSAAYGDTTSELNGVAGDWNQESWQLDLRATYYRAISARATASAYAGVQYYTHDSASVDGISISSLQNLRLMTGAGLSYAATERTTVHGQLGVYFDAMRHNPHAVEGGIRVDGTEPGRIGAEVGIGADYAISDRWSLQGSYSFDVADDSTEHNVNVGAQYRF